MIAPPISLAQTLRKAVGDGLGGLIYLGPTTAKDPEIADGTKASAGFPIPDSVPVMRADVLSHRVDTIAYNRVADVFMGTVRTDSCGARVYRPMINPLPVRDGWVVLSTGGVALTRVHDFHVDWVAPDGSRTQSPKLPHAWQRLTGSAKTYLLDSLRHQDAERFAAVAVRAGNACAAAMARASAPDYPTLDMLPDYEAPFPSAFSILADADGNVWIPEFPKPEGGGRVYILVNQKGEVFDRLQIPGATLIVGFGPGVVYLKNTIGAGKQQLARARIK